MTTRDIEAGVHHQLNEVDGHSDEENNQLLDESAQVERKPFDMGELGVPGNLSMNESSHMMMTENDRSIDNQIEMAVVANQVANQMLDDSMQSGPTKGGEKKLSASGHQSDVFTDAITESQASIDTLDNYVGPVREEFDDLKRKIEDRTNELDGLEAEYYKRVSTVALELEGIDDAAEKEIERHRHLYELE